MCLYLHVLEDSRQTLLCYLICILWDMPHGSFALYIKCALGSWPMRLLTSNTCLCFLLAAVLGVSGIVCVILRTQFYSGRSGVS